MNKHHAGDSPDPALLALRLARVLHRAAGAEVFADRIPFRQVQALLVLTESGPLMAGEVGRRLGIAASSATGLLDRMERGGLIEEAPGEDRRRRLVQASRRGRREVETFRRKLGRAMERRLADLPPSRRAELQQAFTVIINILDEGHGS